MFGLELKKLPIFVAKNNKIIFFVRTYLKLDTECFITGFTNLR